MIMTAEYVISKVLSDLMFRSPILIVWIIGLFVTLSMRRQYPRPAMLTAAAMSIFLLGVPIGEAFGLWFTSQLKGDPVHPPFLIEYIETGLMNCMYAVGYILLLLAVFQRRRPEPTAA